MPNRRGNGKKNRRQAPLQELGPKSRRTTTAMYWSHVICWRRCGDHEEGVNKPSTDRTPRSMVPPAG